MNLEIKLWKINILICIFCSNALSREDVGDRSQNPTYYKIGGVLSSNQSEAYFQNIISVSNLIILPFCFFFNICDSFKNYLQTIVTSNVFL